MSKDQFTTICRTSIAAQFSRRNTVVFSSTSRQQEMQRQRRAMVRKWIGALRLAENPRACAYVTSQLAGIPA